MRVIIGRRRDGQFKQVGRKRISFKTDARSSVEDFSRQTRFFEDKLLDHPDSFVAHCPICGGGVCGIRICGLISSETEPQRGREGDGEIHGLVICDQCEAIWVEPDVETVHQYASVLDARCPTCGEPLGDLKSGWASRSDIQTLGWQIAVTGSLNESQDNQDRRGTPDNLGGLPTWS